MFAAFGEVVRTLLGTGTAVRIPRCAVNHAGAKMVTTCFLTSFGTAVGGQSNPLRFGAANSEPQLRIFYQI